MKYLIINGSPHKGNTWKLAMVAKSAIKQIDVHAQWNEIHLLEEKIPFCVGCSQCFIKGQSYCPHASIIKSIIKYIDEADGIIVVSAGYIMSETALLKNFFDHIAFMLHRPYFFNKKALVMTTAGGVGAGKAAKSIMSKLYGVGFNQCYQFSKMSCSWNNYQPKERERLACTKVAIKFAKDISSTKLRKASYGVLIPFNLIRGMSLSYVKGSEYETKDGTYYASVQMKKQVYGYGVPIPFGGRVFGNLFYHIGKSSRKFVTVTYRK